MVTFPLTPAVIVLGPSAAGSNAGPEQVLAYLGRYTHRVAIAQPRTHEVLSRLLVANS
jgi:hypothetical protein